MTTQHQRITTTVLLLLMLMLMPLLNFCHFYYRLHFFIQSSFKLIISGSTVTKTSV